MVRPRLSIGLLVFSPAASFRSCVCVCVCVCVGGGGAVYEKVLQAFLALRAMT